LNHQNPSEEYQEAFVVEHPKFVFSSATIALALFHPTKYIQPVRVFVPLVLLLLSPHSCGPFGLL
jgi:hypothetical protein